jgi:hypothetical protein
MLALVTARAIFGSPFFTIFDRKQLFMNQISNIFSPEHGVSKNNNSNFLFFLLLLKTKQLKKFALLAAKAVLVNLISLFCCLKTAIWN